MKYTPRRKCENCLRPHGGKRICGSCYVFRRGNGRFPTPVEAGECRWDGCTSDRLEKQGYCDAHKSWGPTRTSLALTCIEFESLITSDHPVIVDPKTGYSKVWVADKWEPEHRVVMTKILGREMTKGESVHHINGIRHDNTPDNLELWVGGIRYGQRASDVYCPHCGEAWQHRG